MRRPLYQVLAQLVNAHGNTENEEWRERHRARIAELVREHMPSGGGFDAGTEIDLPYCGDQSLRFRVDYHHMNEHGYYDGWTSHIVTVRASLAHGFLLSISGPNRNDIKDYIGETFDHALRAEVDA